MTITDRTHHNRYDTSLVCLYSLGKEHLVPIHLRRLVPRSTASDWRRLEANALIGHELRALQLDALEHQELLSRYSRLRTTVRVLTKVWMGVSDFLLPAVHAQKAHAVRVVDAVQHLFTVMPRERALRLVHLSSSAFHDRLQRIKARCGLSPLARCFRRHPAQLSLREVHLIKDLFADRSLACWPGSSLYYEGLRHRGLHIALSTFYKYTRILGLKRTWPAPACKREGLRASRPNEYLHVDTTFWALDDGLKAAIVLVSDNISKAVLGSCVSVGKHAINVVEAVRRAINTIQRYHPNDVCAVLVADGGGENHAAVVEELLASVRHPLISKVTALKDIAFSNSPIEAINRTLKRYLRFHNPRTLEATRHVVDMALHDINAARPHASLKGLTPMQRYTDPGLELDFRSTLQTARVVRLVENRSLSYPDHMGNRILCALPCNAPLGITQSNE